MQELAALLLLKLAGKDGSTDEITSVITAAGKEVDATALETLLKELGDSDVNELLAAGMEKLKDVKMGGGGGGGAGGAGDDAAEAEVEEEKPEEEEMDLGGGMDMFGDAGGEDY